LKSCTKKADEIHDYFINLEKLTLETISEESVELRLQLQTQKTSFIKERQQILLDSYNLKSIVYLIKIRENMYKFGNTNNIKRRFCEHYREINSDIELIYCLESKNNTKVENDLKEYLKKTDLRKEEIFNNKIQTELIQTNNIKMIQDKLEKINKPLNEYIEILKKELLELKNENDKLKQQHLISENANIKERERYQKRKVTEQYKKTRQEYYKKNKIQIKEREDNNRKKKSKTAFVNTDAEQIKFKNWLELNITQRDDSKLIWWELLDKYLGYRTSALISKVYKDYFVEYISDKFVGITTKYVQFKINEINVRGYKKILIRV
jgi:predicted GIY-YIG superfamily endonuclease